MSVLFNDDPFDVSASRKALVLILAASTTIVLPLLVWPHLLRGLLKTDFLPHLFCYLRNPALVWTHVISDALIGFAYFAISVTVAYLIYRTRRDIPFHWMVLAFGLFIIACGGTHFMEVVTVWVPVYVFSAVVKVYGISLGHYRRGTPVYRATNSHPGAKREVLAGGNCPIASQRRAKGSALARGSPSREE